MPVRKIGPVLSLLVLAGCGSTGHFVEQPPVALDDGPPDVRQSVAQLFGAGTPYTVKLCEADPSSKQCKGEGEGISATGVGGLLFPLILYVNALKVTQEHPSDDGLALDLTVDSKADGIPPLCDSAQGRVIARGNNTAAIQITDFYCNWMLVGNVLAHADLSIDRIDLKDRIFTGYYKLIFHGTGNVSGSGYYKAMIAAEGLVPQEGG